MEDDKATPVPASDAELKAAPAGAETVIGDHVASSFLPAPGKRWFWLNLLMLIVLAPFATFWFQRHLEPYFTQILLVGGSLTLWAVIRLVWEIIEKMTKVDPWDRSRSLLASPAVTRVLLVAAISLGVLWFATASLYFEHAGPGAGEAEYVVQVMRKPEQARFMDNVSVSSSDKVFGGPYFWRQAEVPLECRIVKPTGFDVFDCSLHAGASTRVKVPGSFEAKKLHLLRLVPAGMAFAELPEADDPPGINHRLELTVDGVKFTLDDVRKQTITLGGKGDDMALAATLDKPNDLSDTLVKALRAEGADEASAQQTASVLSTHVRVWDVVGVKPGQKLSLSMTWLRTVDGKTTSGVMQGFPVHYTVTSDKVQTIWLPSH